jgi:hypothetical protein
VLSGYEGTLNCEVNFSFYKRPLVTGDEAMEGIIEALKAFHRKNPSRKPTRLQMPWGLAFDLAKLGRIELGDLADQIITDGIAALETQGFKGLRVSIDLKNQYGDVVAA